MLADYKLGLNCSTSSVDERWSVFRNIPYMQYTVVNHAFPLNSFVHRHPFYLETLESMTTNEKFDVF